MTDSILDTPLPSEEGLAFPKNRRAKRLERQRIAQQSKAERATLEREAGWRTKEMARQRDGHRCRFCPARAYEIAHGFGEGAYPSVRFIGINLFNACRPCHDLGHQHPERWRTAIAVLLGPDDFAKLERAAMAAGDGPRPEDVIAAAKRGEFVELAA